MKWGNKKHIPGSILVRVGGIRVGKLKHINTLLLVGTIVYIFINKVI